MRIKSFISLSVGEDYIGGIFTKQFEEFSSARMTCIQIPILEDGVVEDTDTFTVSLHVETTTGELTIGKSVTTVIIHDSSEYLIPGLPMQAFIAFHTPRDKFMGMRLSVQEESKYRLERDLTDIDTQKS